MRECEFTTALKIISPYMTCCLYCICHPTLVVDREPLNVTSVEDLDTLLVTVLMVSQVAAEVLAETRMDEGDVSCSIMCSL